jgi:uncharacterized protein (DUF1778 family)
MRSEITTKKLSPSAIRTVKTARIEARTSPAKKTLYQRAAELKGQTFTECVERSLDEAAERAQRESEAMQLAERDARIFVSALLSDTTPSVRLSKAAKQYRDRTGS